MSQLVDEARRLGVAMGSKHGGYVIGWTTDEAKATACREAGLLVTAGYNATGPVGWEVRTPDGSQAAPPSEDVQAANGTDA